MTPSRRSKRPEVMAVAKVGLGLSGGVDSAVAAHLLQAAGHDVLALHMALTPQSLDSQEAKDARALADLMGLDFHLLDARAYFQDRIVAPFIRAYESGHTPNPCVTCNGLVKFGLLWEEAQALGCELLATGHYARIGTDAQGRPRLFQGADKAKDQSYFMVRMPREVLPFLRLPLGAYSKDQVRRMAQEAGLPVAQKKDSQEICFIPRDDYVAFLEGQGLRTRPGPFKDPQGQVLGQHTGIHHYTIGQRRGLGLALGRPAYVTAIDGPSGTVTVGPSADLMESGLVADQVVFHRPLAEGSQGRALAKIRSRGPGQAATWTFHGDRLYVAFDQDVRALSPGQTLVLYEDDMVLAGGRILGPWQGPSPR